MKNFLVVAFSLVAFCQSNYAQKALDNKMEKKIDSLMALMTLEEKVGQMNQYNGFWNVTGPVPKEGDASNKYEHLKKGWVGSMLNVRGVEEVRKVQKIVVEESRLGIPLIIGFDVIHGYRTQSPIPLAESASWDLEAIEASAAMAAEEAAASGITWTFAPMVDISRDARWGRVMEGAGEDPYLGSQIAKARINGFQGKDLSASNTIAATAKHFAGYGFSESGRDYNTVDVGTSTLYNIIFPPFMAAVEADVKTFMNSFNILNGIPATGNSFLQREVLKGEWDYKGFVVTDWGSMTEMITHGYSKDGESAAESAANAGSDMDMESYLYVKHLKNLVNEGKVSLDKVDDAVRRILRVKFELGLFDDPYKYCNEEREKTVVGSDKNMEIALGMAEKSIVLLKNNDQLLPLKKNGINIAVIGSLAADKNSPLGSWRLASKDNTAVSVLEGLKKYKGNKLSYEKGVELVKGQETFINELDINTTDRTGIAEAVEVAKNKDVVVMVLGEHGFQSGEGRSRTNLDLSGLQQELLEAVYAVNSNIVLVLMNGRPLTINWANDNVPAIVEAWQLGSRSGDAIAKILYGDYNPSGKLPMTFPKNVGQVPLYYNYMSTGRPSNPGDNLVFWSHYTDEANTPLYEFGHGLSYTSFSYDKLKLSANSLNKTGELKVSFDLSNTGKYEGKEVVQLYIQDLFASRARPVKELKDFKMVSLKPGETKNVSFTISAKKLEFYSANNKWEAETGDFKVFIGGSSATQLESDFTLKN
ncbi:beta-glucosidase BglX [Zobellia uliginosa]|uniref:beta-glucosidase BglX n=1 Tax=Zobellia uliginosa TaxID=143224 RepID=UPI001C074858|nr:beta-glucosidase BglX [Zobellia uliginosa]MBU2945303.1 beta-glucosidase BglX [Zobellia uliginosa]